MGILTEIDFLKLEPIAEKHGITTAKAYEIWNDVHNISEQVRIENIPLEYLKKIHQDISELLKGFATIKP